MCEMVPSLYKMKEHREHITFAVHFFTYGHSVDAT